MGRREGETKGRARAYEASKIPAAKTGCGGVDSDGHRVCIMSRQSREAGGEEDEEGEVT